MLIDGRKIAESIINELKGKPKPGKIFAAILVGENVQSISFLKQKERVAKELNVDFRIYKFPESLTSDELRKEVGKIALLKNVGGVIVQLPLPKQINSQYVLNVIPREKDVDVLGERALGAFYAGRNLVLPPSIGVVEELVHGLKFIVQGSKVAIVGLGFLIGKPIATWLMGKVSELYLLDIGSDLSILKQADLIISGVGKNGLIKSNMLKENTIVIDFGYSIDEDGKIKGDFDISDPSFKIPALPAGRQDLCAYTPTPGGTGPILVAKIFENFYSLNNG